MSKTKKDIDKDLMYKMLMPSGSKTLKTASATDSRPSAMTDEQTPAPQWRNR